MKKRTSETIKRMLTNLFIILLGLGMLYPILWLIAASFKQSNTIFSDPGLLPKPFTLENYGKGWKGIGIVGFDVFFRNSLPCASSVPLPMWFSARLPPMPLPV